MLNLHKCISSVLLFTHSYLLLIITSHPHIYLMFPSDTIISSYILNLVPLSLSPIFTLPSIISSSISYFLSFPCPYSLSFPSLFSSFLSPILPYIISSSILYFLSSIFPSPSIISHPNSPSSIFPLLSIISLPSTTSQKLYT